MRLVDLRIQNFRSFSDETVHLDGYACFVGPNGAGKSTVLRALNVLFRNPTGSSSISELGAEDFHDRDTSKPVRITASFADLSDVAYQDLKAYVRQDRLAISAVATWDGATQKAVVRQHGSRLVMSDFARFFEEEKNGANVATLTKVYAETRKRTPELTAAKTKAEMTKALRDYEESHPELCEFVESPDEFYGWSRGKNLLARHVQWVYVPAVKDAATEQLEGRNTALGILLQRTIGAKIRFDEEVERLRSEFGDKYQAMIRGHEEVLSSVSESIERRLKGWAHPGVELKLAWNYERDKSVVVSDPTACVRLAEGGFMGSVVNMGHGLQRAFIVSLLQELAETGEEEQPTLILAIEEPELYQHPPQARHLSEVLERLAEKDCQVLVTTHSPLFVSGRGFEDVRMVRRSHNGGTTVSQATGSQISDMLAAALGESPGSHSSVIARVEQILQPSQNELFFCSVPVIVEGVEDIAVVATYLRLTDCWSRFRELGCHFVQSGGKNSMSRLAAIARCLRVPAFIVFDGDSDAKPVQIKANARDNACLLSLCGYGEAPAVPAEDFWASDLVMWATQIQPSVAADVGQDVWSHAQEAARSEHCLAGVQQKNGLLIAATLEGLWAEGYRSPRLERLCRTILHHAETNQ